MQLLFYYCGKHLACTWLDFLAQPRARCTCTAPPSECISLSKIAKCNLSAKKEWRKSQWIERHSRHDFRNLVVMFLNLTQHLVEKVMLQNIKTTTTTTAGNCLRPTTTTLLRNSKTYTKKEKTQCTELFTASLVAAAEEWGTYVEAADLMIIKCKLPNELGARTTIHNVNLCLFCTTILPFPQRSSSRQHTDISLLYNEEKKRSKEQRWSLSGPGKLRRPNRFSSREEPVKPSWSV